jgi:RHS repeat-associated protein
VQTGYGYDAAGQLTYVTNACGTGVQTITHYTYDELGQLLKQFDANQDGAGSPKATAFEYDFIGRRVTRTLPGNQSETFGYSVTVGHTLQIAHVDFNGQTTTIDHDPMGRVLTKKVGTSPQVTMLTLAYDPLTRQRASMVDPSGTTSYTYDDNTGRLMKKSHLLLDNTTALGDLNYTYDANGNVLTVQSSHSGSGGLSLTYHWDALNRLVQVDDGFMNSTKYGYDKVGNLQDFTYPTTTSVKTSYTYNALNRLTVMGVANSSAAVLALYDYTPGPVGNWLAATEKINAPTIGGVIDRSLTYLYDDLYRLTNEAIAAVVPDNTYSGLVTGTINYGTRAGSESTTGYDKVGNRKSRTLSSMSGATVTGFGSTTFTFDANDRVSGSTFDANGNTLIENLALQPLGVLPVVPATGHEDVYDFENRLVQRSDGTTATAVQIIYDGDGNRVEKIVGSTPVYYLVDARNPTGYAQVAEELTGSGTLSVNRVYNYGHNLISQYTKNGGTWNVNYYGYDGHGSVRFLMDGAGAITDTYTYDAFGVLLNKTGSTGFATTGGTSGNNYLYCGEQYDPDLGTYYLRARYMNPGTGRFWTMDTYEGDHEDPRSLHKYLYGADNPVDEIDPLGQSFFAFDGTGNAPSNPDQTNVRKMWYGSTDPDRHYEVGVGTAWGTRTFGGATGAGMARRENTAMGELIHDRQKTDTRMDIVGFSRGGIEATEFANRVADAFPDEEIRFVGLFDPVGSVGFPGSFGRYRFQLPAQVEYSAEAMAANENRSWFPATDVNVTVQQWFRGTHSDIGGGWPNHQLSDYVLQWMIQQAKSSDVEINLSAIQDRFGWNPNPSGPIDPNQGVTSWRTTGGVRNVLSATGGGYTFNPSDAGF